MARRKGKAARGKSRVPRAPMVRTGGYLTDITVDLGATDSAVTDRCPLCAAMGVQLEPSGHARGIVRAAVSHAQTDTA